MEHDQPMLDAWLMVPGSLMASWRFLRMPYDIKNFLWHEVFPCTCGKHTRLFEPGGARKTTKNMTFNQDHHLVFGTERGAQGAQSSDKPGSQKPPYDAKM